MKFPKEVVKVFEKKLNREHIASYYNDLVDKWHDECKDDIKIAQYLGLTDELYALFVKDEAEFLSKLEDEYRASKIMADAKNHGIEISHQHLDECMKNKYPLYGSFN